MKNFLAVSTIMSNSSGDAVVEIKKSYTDFMLLAEQEHNHVTPDRLLLEARSSFILSWEICISWCTSIHNTFTCSNACIMSLNLNLQFKHQFTFHYFKFT